MGLLGAFYAVVGGGLVFLDTVAPGNRLDGGASNWARALLAGKSCCQVG